MRQRIARPCGPDCRALQSPAEMTKPRQAGPGDNSQFDLRLYQSALKATNQPTSRRHADERRHDGFSCCNQQIFGYWPSPAMTEKGPHKSVQLIGCWLLIRRK